MVRGLPFSTDDFFAAIRECYIRRSENPALRQLTFCLLGTAAPTDLIRDTRLTPFNIGRRIELHDFTEAEAAPLALGLEMGALGAPGRPTGQARALLGRILHWTGGHPYLTQRLCAAVADCDSGPSGPANPQSGYPREWVIRNPQSVDRLCEGLFLASGAQGKDNNLIFVRERLLRSGEDVAALLELYRKVRVGKRVADDETSPLCSLLKLSGIARAEGARAGARGRLRARNRIYERVFDARWVREHMPDAELRRQRAAYRKGLVRASALAGAVLAVMAGLAGFALQQQRVAEDRLVRLCVASGMRLVEEGNLLGALPWLAEALRLDHRDRAREEAHRIRLAAVLRQCPKLARAWFHDGPVNDAAFSPDGRRVVTASADSTARVWDTAMGQSVTQLLGHAGPVTRASFSPDGRRVVTASLDRTARVWDAATGSPVGPPLRHEDRVVDAGFSPDGGRVVTASLDRTARVWRLPGGGPALPPLRHAQSLTCASFSPDGRRLVTATGTWPGANTPGEAQLWDAATGKPTAPTFRYLTTVRSATFSPDSRTVLLATYTHRAYVRHATTGKPVMPEVLHDHRIEHAAFSADGRRFVTTSWDNTARVWETATGNAVAPPLKHAGRVMHAVFSPDGSCVATASMDRTARIWRVATGEPVSPPLPHGSSVLRVAFTLEGRFLLTASADRTARLWDRVTAGLAAHTLQHPAGVVGAGGAVGAGFDPEGRRLVTAGSDGAARIWDMAIGEPLTPPLKHGAGLSSAEFSPDGRRVVTAAWDNTARV